jgi:hypothetical protein
MFYLNKGQRIIHESFKREFEKQGNPIQWAGLDTALYQVIERYKHYRIHPSEMDGEVSQEEAEKDVFEVLVMMINSRGN